MESIKREVDITESEDSASEDIDDEEDKDDELLLMESIKREVGNCLVNRRS
jgi:hypothetical protein